jgi:hypothetical protein
LATELRAATDAAQLAQAAAEAETALVRTDLEAACQLVEAAERERGAAQATAQEAQDVANALQQTALRKARGRWARLRAAWRGD